MRSDRGRADTEIRARGGEWPPVPVSHRGAAFGPGCGASEEEVMSSLPCTAFVVVKGVHDWLTDV